MALFGLLKNKEPEASVTFPAILGAAAKGTFVPMAQIPDEMFSDGIMGTCCGVEPSEGKVYAPIDCKISQLTDTRHAIGVEAGGMNILIHVGVDTVNMKGDGFSNAGELGQTVKKGDLLLTMDLEKIRAVGYPTTVILAVTNSDDFSSVKEIASGSVEPGDGVLQVEK